VTVSSCTADGLEAALARGHGREVIWFRGYPNWHAVRALTTAVAVHFAGRAGAAPVVLVEGGRADAAPLERIESTK
jgi:hypothetical protein